MLKKDYQTPLIELYELKLEGAVMQFSQRNVESMSRLSTTWDDEEE